MTKNNLKLLISGCGRSGTKYITKLLNELNVIAFHEVQETKCEVIVDWHLLCNNPFKEIPMIHQVRDPLKTISSVTKISSVSWDLIKEKIPIEKTDSTILKAMKYYYHWNKLAQTQSLYTYRVENIENEIEKILELVGVKEYDKSIIDNIPKNVNTRKHTDYSWDILKRIDLPLANKIIELGKSYGYNL